MSTTKDFLEYVLEQLSGLDGVECRSMMGEYILYYKGKIAAYVCDNRLLVKPVQSAIADMPCARMEKPYEGATKDMLLVEDIDDGEFLCKLFDDMYDELPFPKKKKKS